MLSINAQQYEDFKKLLPQWAPETELDTPRGVMEVDQQRRQVGAQPTTLGAAIENTYLQPRFDFSSTNPNEADAAPRGLFQEPTFGSRLGAAFDAGQPSNLFEQLVPIAPAARFASGLRNAVFPTQYEQKPLTTLPGWGGHAGAPLYSSDVAVGAESVAGNAAQGASAIQKAIQPKTAGEELFGLRSITPGMGRVKSAIAGVQDRLGIGVPNNEIATPAMEMRAAVQPRIQSQAAQISARVSSTLQKAFTPNAAGRVESLPGSPTIADVAARRPEFEMLLSDAQRNALDTAEGALAPVRRFLDEVGLSQKIGSRPDVMEGGFYIPRGNAMEEGADIPLKVRAGTGQGKAGFQREATFNSQAEGLDAGFQYTNLRDSIRGYVQAAGKLGTNEHVASYLRNFGREIPESGVSRYAAPIGPGLPIQGIEFPDEIANAVNKVLAQEGPTLGKEAHIGKALSTFNGIYRSLHAGGEMSYLTIQGLPGAASDPKAYGTAVRLATKAWGRGGDNVLGAYLDDFSRTRSALGKPDAAQWVASGLHIGGPETEFTIGQGLGKKLSGIAENLPLIRQSNRGFGTFGDVLRTEWADSLWDAAKASGKNMDDPRVMESIAKTANRLTGYSEQRAFGSWGDVLNFAPRFFAARVQSLAQLVSRDPFERELARKTLGRFLGTATLMTVAINSAMGRNTDFNPIKRMADGSYIKNPNFMRIRALGQDWSLLGAYDALLGLGIAAGTGNVQNFARQFLSSPAIQSAWDLFSGSTLTGTPTRDVTPGAPLGGLASSETAKYVGGQQLPFAAAPAVTGVRQLAQGDIAKGTGSLLQAETGLKGSPLTPTEQMDELTPGGDFWGATPKVRDRLKQEHPDIWQAIVSKGGADQKQAEQIKGVYAAEQEKDDSAFLSGSMPATEYRDRRTTRNIERSAALAVPYMDNPERKPDPTKPWEVYASKIAQAKRDNNGIIDSEALAPIEAWRATLTQTQNDSIDENTGLGSTPLDKEFRADMKRIAASGYFDIRDNAVSEVMGKKTTWAAEMDAIRRQALAEAEATLNNEDPQWRSKAPTAARQLADATTRQAVSSIAAQLFTPIQQGWRADEAHQDVTRLLQKWGIAGTGTEETVTGIARQLSPAR